MDWHSRTSGDGNEPIIKDQRLDKDGKRTPFKRVPMGVSQCCLRWTENSKVGQHAVAQCPLLKRMYLDS